MSIFDLLRWKKKIPSPWQKYYSESEFNITIPDISMYKQIKNSSIKFPNNVAIEYMNKKIKYKKLIKSVDKMSISLKKMGIEKGDIVTICLPNIPEALIVLYALNKIGAVASMLHPLSAEEEIKNSVNSTKSKLLVMLDKFYEKIENTNTTMCVNKVIFVSPANSLNILFRTIYNIKEYRKFKHHPLGKKYMSYRRLMTKSLFKKNIRFPKMGRDVAAVILQSGGTSGKPKNVVLQNRAFILGSKQEVGCLDITDKDSCLGIMPNFHGFGLSVCMHTPLANGAKTILIPQFNGKKFDTLFKKTKPSIVLGVPTLYEALITYKNEENLDLSFLRYAISGGDVLSKKLEDKVNEFLKSHNSNARITQGFGCSEALAAVCLGYGDINKSGSVGIPLPGNHIKIIDPNTMKTVKYGTVGEICIHSKALMMGYLNDESETNTVLQVHDDGHVWLHTGDLGYMDKDGFVFYKSRLKRMIISSGYNVYPSHVEEVIESHPSVLQCSIVGVPHPYKQQVVKAFVVLKPGCNRLFIKQQLKDYCSKNLAKYMVPYEIVIRKGLPTTKLGKVDFKTLQNDNRGDDDE